MGSLDQNNSKCKDQQTAKGIDLDSRYSNLPSLYSQDSSRWEILTWHQLSSPPGSHSFFPLCKYYISILYICIFSSHTSRTQVTYTYNSCTLWELMHILFAQDHWDEELPIHSCTIGFWVPEWTSTHQPAPTSTGCPLWLSRGWTSNHVYNRILNRLICGFTSVTPCVRSNAYI